MGDDERGDPAPAAVEVAEEQAHHQVAGEAAEALIEVVAAAQHRRQADGRPVAQAQLAQLEQDEADHHALLEHGVLQRGEHQHRIVPPHVVQRVGHDGQVESERVGDQIESQTHRADPSRDHRTTGDVATAAPASEPHRARARAGHDQQVGHERHGREREADPQQLVDQVEPGAVGGDGGVEGRGLSGQWARSRRGLEEADHRVDGGASERDGQDDGDLDDDQAARPEDSADRGDPRAHRVGRGRDFPVALHAHLLRLGCAAEIRMSCG